MSKRHNAIFDDVLRDLPEGSPKEKTGTRFLKRSNALSESGEREEKLLRWVDPEKCIMWDLHNRAYDLLNEENCRDLIDSLRAQGRQEFPAIVRRLPSGSDAEYEVICGARRHFAVSWLRANNFPQFRYLIEVRDITDEEAFRLADIENREREDLSDYERARDYLRALDLYYGGKQKAMAARLEVSEGWLSRYLYLARLPQEIVNAWPQITELKELHARALRPLLSDDRDAIIAAAKAVSKEQEDARAGRGSFVPVAKVLSKLKSAVYAPTKSTSTKAYGSGRNKLRMKVNEKAVQLYFQRGMGKQELRKAFDDFVADYFAEK